MRSAALLLLPFLAFGCSSSSSDGSPTGTTHSELSLDDFSQDCNVDADCTPAWSGDVCSDDCGCANGAIAESAEAAYAAKLKSGRDACVPAAPVHICNCPAQSAECDHTTKKCKLH